MSDILIPKILVIIKFNNNIPDIIKILPRTTLFLYLYNYINSKLKTYYSSNKDYNIILKYSENNIKIKWNDIIGIFYDTLFTYNGKNKKIILNCEFDNNKIEYPINNINFILQQILKFGLASIKKSVKFFMNLSHDEINNYILFCNSENTVNIQEMFFEMYKKICKESGDFYIPLVFINKTKAYYYLYKYECKGETLNDILNTKQNFNTNNKKIIVNGIDFNIIKDINLQDIILNLISTNFYIHICYYEYCEILLSDI